MNFGQLASTLLNTIDMELSKSFFQGRRLETLVENQTTYTLQHAEMHVFETHQQAERVLLKFDQPVLASMLQGKKLMHLRDQEAFELPLCCFMDRVE